MNQSDMTDIEAIEFIEYNTIRALPYTGKKGPMIVYTEQENDTAHFQCKNIGSSYSFEEGVKMREILFRGKRTYNSGWIEGGYCYCDNKAYIVISTRYIPDTRGWDEADYYEENPVCKPLFIEVIPKTIGQYTGLTDKNGKKIFEGDIVNFKTIAYTFKKCVVKYDEQYAKFVCIDLNKVGFPMDISFVYEIIGNIHDNPELLGVQR